MDISTVSKTADHAIATLNGALEDKPTGLSRILLAYAPRIVEDFLKKGRFRLHQLRHHEKAFDETFEMMRDVRKKLLEASISSESNTPILRIQLTQLEKEYRLLQTFKLALPYTATDDDIIDDSSSDSDAVWWDMFEDLASRRNENWRVNLFARSIAENDKSPGSIGLKALWEIAMMESSDFASLSIFCDSSIYIDGKPIVLMEPDEQYQYESELNHQYTGNLALCINSLIDKNLIQKVSTQFMTTEPVELQHKSGLTLLHHSVLNLPDKSETAIRIDGFSPTDHCLDICKLYSPILNIASDRNLELMKEQLNQQMEQVESDDYQNVFEFVAMG